MASRQAVLFQWGVSSFFGWGVYGLNLMLGWAARPDLMAVSTCWFDPSHLAVSPDEQRTLEPLLEASREVHEQFARLDATQTVVPIPMLHALGNNLCVTTASADRNCIFGQPTIGVVFSESTQFDASARDRAAQYPLIIAGSNWNRTVLAAHGIGHVEVVLQGVDTARFQPAPWPKRSTQRFVVFSGGKLERRKGQDLVVQAFAAFAQRHPDALLVTAWNSPWPSFALTVNENTAMQPVGLDGAGQIDAAAWTRANGIPDDQVVHLGTVPNADMPELLRKVDVALFPNRAEGGTNLVAMECMACGIPTILSANTGHLDLLGDGSHCLALGDQGAVPGPGQDGWGESSVEEIVDVLEAVHRSREAAAAVGLKGAAFMRELSWARQMDVLAETILPYLAASSRAQAAAAA